MQNKQHMTQTTDAVASSSYDEREKNYREKNALSAIGIVGYLLCSPPSRWLLMFVYC